MTIRVATLSFVACFALVAQRTQTLTNQNLVLPRVQSYTVATLPTPTSGNPLAIVTDAATAGSCTSGSGSARALCRWSGSAWAPVGDGGTTSASEITSGTLAAARGGTGADLSAAAGILKIASGTTSAATAGTDYYAPGGAISSADLPFPGASAKGSILTTACTSGQYVTAYGTDGVPVCSTPSGGGGGASAVADLTDFKVAYVDSTTLSVGGGTIVVGTKRFTIAADTTCTLTATAADSALFYHLNGTFVIGMTDSGSSVACSGWTAATGISAFPAGSIPIYKWTATTTPGSWDAAGGTDYRALFHRQEPEAGNGITVTESGTTGRQTIAVDAATVPQFSPSTDPASGSCTVGQVWIETDDGDTWDCTATDTWTQRLSPAGTATLTNKVLDVEGTGNSVTTVDLRSWPAAKCQNGAAGATANLPATYAPVPACITGTNVLTAALTWPDADGDYSIQDSFRLPFDWSGYVNFHLKWRTSATSGDIVWQLSTACVADGETVDPSFNTAQTVTDTAKGTTLQENDASISTITMTGCAAGETLYWKLLRNRTHASDTLAATADLLSYAFRIRRMQ